MPNRILAYTALLAAIALTACTPYRADIQQGSYLTKELVDQVEIGMTRDQVRFLLGTPMIDDPFHDDRWDYTYYLDSRYVENQRTYVVVWFEGDTVTRVEIRDPPAG